MTTTPDIRRSYPDDARIGMWTERSCENHSLRTFNWRAEQPRGSILWLGGRGDIFEKYLEAFGEWQRAGWSVFSFDWYGQGGSGRVLADPLIGHIGDFGGWVSDLASVWDSWSRDTTRPLVVMGHSMGGHLVLRALIEKAISPDAVVLSAPMLGFGGTMPGSITQLVARLLGTIMPYRSAWKGNERPAARGASRQFFLTHDADRYADEMWWKAHKPELALGPPSWGWMNAAVRSCNVIDAPGALEAIDARMLIVGTDGDQLVSPVAIRRAAARIPGAELLMFDHDVAHEILRERNDVRDRAMRRIATFLDTVTST